MKKTSSRVDSSPIHEFLTSIDSLDWSTDNRYEALRTLIRSALKVGQQQVLYYEDVRSKQKFWSRGFRFGMVIFGGAGFLFPLLRPWIPAGSDIGYICLALAAICVTGNSVFAVSSNQSRFLLTRFSLEKLLAEFRLAVAAAEISWVDKKLSDDQLRAMIDFTKTFLAAVFDCVTKETGEWSKETQDAIDAISKKLDTLDRRVGG